MPPPTWLSRLNDLCVNVYMLIQAVIFWDTVATRHDSVNQKRILFFSPCTPMSLKRRAFEIYKDSSQESASRIQI